MGRRKGAGAVSERAYSRLQRGKRGWGGFWRGGWGRGRGRGGRGESEMERGEREMERDGEMESGDIGEGGLR